MQTMKRKLLPALQSQPLPDHSMLCQLPSAIFQQCIVTGTSNTSTASNSLLYPASLKKSGFTSTKRVDKNLHTLFSSNIKYQEHLNSSD